MDNSQDIARFFSVEPTNRNEVRKFLVGVGSSVEGFARRDGWLASVDSTEAVRFAFNQYSGVLRAWSPSEDLHPEVRRALAWWLSEDARYWQNWWNRPWRKALSRALLEPKIPAVTDLLSLGATLTQLQGLAEDVAARRVRHLPEIGQKAAFCTQAVLTHGGSGDWKEFFLALDEHVGWLSTVRAWAVLVETWRRRTGGLPAWLCTELNAFLADIRVRVDEGGMLHESSPTLAAWLYRVLYSRQSNVVDEQKLCQRCGLPAAPRKGRGPRPKDKLCALCAQDMRRSRWRDSKRTQRKAARKAE